MKLVLLLKKDFTRYQLPALLWTLLIFALSSIPNLAGPDLGFRMQDKFYHFTFYGFYGILLALAFYNQNRFPALRRYFLVFTILFGMIYGLSDEIHQYFVPGRQMDFFDLLADSSGVAFGAVIFHLRYHIKRVMNFSQMILR
ncbi:MAG: VanZ family protein [Calditrichia bacterium]